MKRLDINPNRLISIARTSPKGFNGFTCSLLAPSAKLLSAYKSNGDTKYYIQKYDEQLAKLDPEELYHSLGTDSILLCWEGPNKFCHRHLVAEWFMKNLITEVGEYL